MQTIIAAFDDRTSAQRAADDLIDQGIPRSMVHVQSGHDTDMSTSTTTRSSGESDGFFASIGNFFNDLFGDEDSAGKYAETVRRGGTVVLVDTPDDIEAERVRALLAQSAGSVDVDERATQWRGEGWTGFDASAQPMTASTATATATGVNTTGETVLPVVQEELKVGKRTVEGGVVRVVKRVTETPVSELVRLRDERATIERRPVDRVATSADLENFQEGTIEVRESSEEAVVSKSARVVEEVVVGKEVTEHAETVSDSVRRTDVEVERGTSGTAHAVPGGSTLDTTTTRSDFKP